MSTALPALVAPPAGDPALDQWAAAVLLAVECRTAHLILQSRQASAWYLTPRAVQDGERALEEAAAGGCDLPLKPHLQDLERYAPCWADLLSDADPALCAALARALGGKYTLVHAAVPRLRLALGLDRSEVQAAYARLYDRPLSALYAPAAPAREGLRWRLAGLAARLESLPPFWLTFALTLPGAAGLLALPIALARVGLGAGLVLLLAFGLLNALTAVAMAEAVARSGNSRFGLGFLGQLVHEYLGPAGGIFLTATLALNNFFALIAFFLGVSTTLEDAIGLRAELWIAALFGACLYFLSRKSLNAAVATTLVIVLANLLILLAIPILALLHGGPAAPAPGSPPFAADQLLRPSTWQLILGVLLSTFFSHYLVATYGPVVLRRDPGGRSWIMGTGAAILAIVAVGSLWLVVVNSVVPASVLAASTGTVLSPLADRVGPAVHVLGSLLVILSLGLTSVQIALGLYFLVQERRPHSPGRLGRRAWFWLAAAPVVAVFLIAEAAVVAGVGTFAWLLAFFSGLALPLLSGVFPLLLLAATRRKGDFVPRLVLKPLGHPAVLAVLYLLFVGSILVYGLFIYQAPIERLAHIVVGAVVLLATAVLLRRGALDRRAVIELRRDPASAGWGLYRVMAGGRPAVAQVRLSYLDGEEQTLAADGGIPECAVVRAVTIALPQTGARTLKVWVHQITAEGASVALPARVTVTCGEQVMEPDLAGTRGQALLPINGGSPCVVDIRLLAQD